MDKLRQSALPWLWNLPKRFQDEFEGMAEGANLPIQRLAEWAYVEECEINQCSGAVCLIGNRAWVLRNNDTYVPEMWGYVTIREVEILLKEIDRDGGMLLLARQMTNHFCSQHRKRWFSVDIIASITAWLSKPSSCCSRASSSSSPVAP
jgi:hypothetical protein